MTACQRIATLIPESRRQNAVKKDSPNIKSDQCLDLLHPASSSFVPAHRGTAYDHPIARNTRVPRVPTMFRCYRATMA